MGIRERIVRWLASGRRSLRENAIIVPNYRVAIGEYQVENIRAAIDAYTHDGDIYGAVNFISNAALSQGFYVSGSQEYRSGKVVDLIRDFNDSIRWGNRRGEKGLASLLRIVTKELLYGGNTFIEMLTPNNLQLLNQVELSSIYKVYRNESGDVSKIQQMIGGRLNDLDPDTIIHIPWLQVDREAFGRGLIQPLIAPRIDVKGREIPPLYIIKASLEYDIYRILHRRGVPRVLWAFPSAGDELVESYAKALQDPDIDASFTTNAEVKIAAEQGGPAQGISNLITYLDKRFQVGLQTPINNLLNSSSFTEASARVSQELGGLIIKDLQMRLKQAIETELYERIILQAGLDPKKAKIELHWGAQEEPDYQLSDVWQFFDRKLITVSETRKILRKVGWELEDDSGLSKQMQDYPTATTTPGRQVVVQPDGSAIPNVGLITNPVNVSKQASAQGLASGQTGMENPNRAETK